MLRRAAAANGWWLSLVLCYEYLTLSNHHPHSSITTLHLRPLRPSPLVLSFCILDQRSLSHLSIADAHVL